MMATRETQHGGVTLNQFFKGPNPADLLRRDCSASISVSAGFATSYGQTKCTVTVTLQCDQDPETLKAAYDIAFEAAHAMAVDGMNRLEQDGQSFANGYGRQG